MLRRRLSAAVGSTTELNLILYNDNSDFKKYQKYDILSK
jgi:hypothetical protein